jgi:hypothetical protein
MGSIKTLCGQTKLKLGQRKLKGNDASAKMRLSWPLLRARSVGLNTVVRVFTTMAYLFAISENRISVEGRAAHRVSRHCNGALLSKTKHDD